MEIGAVRGTAGLVVDMGDLAPEDLVSIPSAAADFLWERGQYPSLKLGQYYFLSSQWGLRSLVCKVL